MTDVVLKIVVGSLLALGALGLLRVFIFHGFGVDILGGPPAY